MKRILTGGIAQESHSFNPIPTLRDRFTVQSGREAIERNRGANSTLGGILDSADEIGVEVLVPTLFRAQSGGPVADEVFAEVRETMVDAARRGDFDAIVLPLHGGMLTPTLEDPEGALIAALRETVGPDVPITAAFDLHAHVTPRTIEPLDFLAAYLTNPHGDQAATSRRAFRAASDILAGRLDPVCSAVFFPMLTLGHDRTDEEPLLGIHAFAAEAVASGRIYDASIFNAQQFLDVEGLGQVILCYGNGDDAASGPIADEIARRVWNARSDLVGRYPSLDSCLDRIEREGVTLVLGDQGDRVAGGGPGDSTFILDALRRRGFAHPSVVPIYDPDAVEACHAAGSGATVELTVGGRYSTVSPPFAATGTVESVGADTPVVYDGPSDGGTRILIERHAVLVVGETRILLTNQPYAYIDPAYLRAVGIQLADMKLIVTRSGYHYSLNFAPVGECITIDTPGITSYYVDRLPWTKARPFHPIDRIDFSPERHVRRRRAIAIA